MVPVITAYRDGKFVTVDAPSWWSEENEWPSKDGIEAGESEVSTYGNELAAHVDAHKLGRDRGYLIRMWDGDRAISVWMPTEADWLDFLTTRVPAFLSLSVGPPIAETLDRLCNVLTSYARHGQGEHIDRFGGESEIDAKRDRMRAARHRTAS